MLSLVVPQIFVNPIVILIVTIIFGSLVLHEYGHCLAAKFMGLEAKEITVYPIGGSANIPVPPNEPVKEFWITLAGPVVNLVLMWLSLAISTLGTLLNHEVMMELGLCSFWANSVMLFFNLIPAFPMDGGRLLRSFLVVFLGYYKATEIAVLVSRMCCVLMFCTAAYFGYFNILIISPLILLAGNAELSRVKNYHLYRQFYQIFELVRDNKAEQANSIIATVGMTAFVNISSVELRNRLTQCVAVLSRLGPTEKQYLDELLNILSDVYISEVSVHNLMADIEIGYLRKCNKDLDKMLVALEEHWPIDSLMQLSETIANEYLKKKFQSILQEPASSS